MTAHIVALQASLSFTISWSLLKLMFIESVMPSNHHILCCPFLLLPSILSSIRVFSKELALLITWPKYWSFSFSINTFNEYSGLISFRIDRFDLTVAQVTVKSLLHHHNSKSSIKKRKSAKWYVKIILLVTVIAVPHIIITHNIEFMGLYY